MGVLRFFLAALVVYSHIDYTIYGYNPGVIAVVVFYLLAGQVVTALWYKAPTQNRTQWFFRDRALRILPVYFVSLAVVVVAWWAGVIENNYFLSADPTPANWLANLTIVPLNYFMYNGVDRFSFLPTAWSLAAEIQFYLLVPLLLSYKLLRRSTFLISVVIYIAAQLYLLPNQDFGYRLLPGILWVFLSGMLLAQRTTQTHRSIILLWLLCCSYTTYLLLIENRDPFLIEVGLGYSLGVPLLLLMRSRRIHNPSFVRWQRRLGAYSYPVFLIHLPIIWCVNALLDPTYGTWWWVLILSLFYAVVVHHLIETPLWRRFRPVLKN